MIDQYSVTGKLTNGTEFEGVIPPQSIFIQLPEVHEVPMEQYK